jgi:hypothetical protein
MVFGMRIYSFQIIVNPGIVSAGNSEKIYVDLWDATYPK